MMAKTSSFLETRRAPCSVVEFISLSHFLADSIVEWPKTETATPQVVIKHRGRGCKSGKRRTNMQMCRAPTWAFGDQPSVSAINKCRKTTWERNLGGVRAGSGIEKRQIDLNYAFTSDRVNSILYLAPLEFKLQTT
jgi:hypothetical protein